MDPESFSSLAECPVCLQVPRNAILYLCLNGHSVCSRCKHRIDTCPIGRCAFPDPPLRNRVLEQMIMKADVPIPCKFAHLGCGAEMLRPLLPAHERACQWRYVPCPGCQERVVFKDLVDHFGTAHRSTFFGNFLIGAYPCVHKTTVRIKFPSPNRDSREWPLFVYRGGGETFVFFFSVVRGTFYVCAFMVGDLGKTARYTCKFTIGQHSANLLRLDCPLHPVDDLRMEVIESNTGFHVPRSLLNWFLERGERTSSLVVDIEMILTG